MKRPSFNNDAPNQAGRTSVSSVESSSTNSSRPSKVFSFGNGPKESDSVNKKKAGISFQ